MEQKKTNTGPGYEISGDEPLISTQQEALNREPTKLCMFFCPEDKVELDRIYHFINQMDKPEMRLSVVVDFHGKKFPEGYDFPDFYWLGNKDFNLLGKKKPALLQWLANRQFDLLISFVKSERKRCRKLIEAVQAELKTGPVVSSNTQVVDVSIAWEDGRMDYGRYYEQIEYYLEQLKIKITR